MNSMATPNHHEIEYFDSGLVSPGDAYTSDAIKSAGYKRDYIVFVGWFEGDPIFEFVDYDRWPNGSLKGGVIQKFSIFCTTGLYRIHI